MGTDGPAEVAAVAAMGKRLRVGVLVSGRGSNLQVLLDARARDDLPADIVVVVSNYPGVPALERAERAGVPTRVFIRSDYPSRQAQHAAIADCLAAFDVGLVVLAGFDRILDPLVVERFAGRIINIHPSLLPAFAGTLHGQAEALAHGVKVSGCTAHLVTNELDSGPIILQSAVPVLEDDTRETLAARILREEHRLLPEAVRLFAAGRLRMEGRRVRILPPKD